MDNEAEEEPLVTVKDGDQNLTVQVWWDDGAIHYTRPTIVTLKSDERLFDKLNRLVPCAEWGLVSYDSTPEGNGNTWYRRLIAENPTTQNRWAVFDLEKAQAGIASLELSARNWSNPRNVPPILIQDIRKIEKRKEARVGEELDESQSRLDDMSRSLMRLLNKG